MFANGKEIAGALLGYSLGMLAIVSTIVTIFYGLTGKVGADTFIRHYESIYVWMWSWALVLLCFTAFSALLSFSSSKNIFNIWIFRLSIYFFLVSFFQSILVMWIGIMALKNADYAS
ncbi:hypothetical protein LF296_15580 [Acinetobacter vivianii]|uniref:Uncharacterized protein n=1 Tax=Acinetobacter vivianii TaxID=1776742 RepID=A0AAJ6NHU9_9GAMM|nr:hypothetical protein [Acinetobacter vivianii]WDZ50713.1 hypothetical protein LF296_15580 [Acinetobacter vivianii]